MVEHSLVFGQGLLVSQTAIGRHDDDDSDDFLKLIEVARHFRVLTVAESRKRLSNLIEITRKAGGKQMFLFATMGDIQTEAPFGQIWLPATSYDPISLFIQGSSGTGS